MTSTRFRRTSVNPPQPWPAPADWAEIKDRVVHYLTKAPAIAFACTKEDDVLSGKPFAVEVAMITDGTWIWPATVDHYARNHDIAPEPDFLQHLRDQDFTLPEVTPEQRAAATAALRS